VGIVPLTILAYARRGLKETARFSEIAATTSTRSLGHVWRTPHRRRVIELGAIWFVAYIATQNGVTFFKDFALTERGMTDAEVGAAIATAAVVAMPFVFLVGRSLDRLGRRATAAVVFSLGAAGTWGCYTLEGRWPLTVALMLGIFASSAFLPVLNALTTELFPTEMRADGLAWSNNLLGRIGYVASPILIGHFAAKFGWGPVIRSTVIFPLIAVALIYWLLPETKDRSLEETAAM
jgi:putative MFS transporter